MSSHNASNTKEQHTSAHGSAHTNIEPASPLHHATTSQMHIGDPHTPSDTNQHKISQHQQDMDKLHTASAKAAPSKPKMEDEVKLHHV